MITPAQGKAIADDIVVRANATILEAKNAAAPRVPYYYRCQELGVLEPWQRAELVRAAEIAVTRNWRVVIGFFLCVVVWASGWFFWIPHAMQSAFLFLFILTCVVPLFVIRTALIRRQIATIARSNAPSMQTPLPRRG